MEENEGIQQRRRNLMIESGNATDPEPAKKRNSLSKIKDTALIPVF
jgi:hypothetical protein